MQAAQVWVQWINARGGIKGHPVRYVVVDDGSDPARHRAAVQDLVENHGVIAFVAQLANLTHQAAGAYLRQRRVPVIGGEVATSIWHENPMYFPQATNIDGLIWGNLVVAHKYLKGRKLGTFTCAEAQGCRDIKSAFADNAGATGFDLAYQGEGSVAAPDFTAQCLAARNAGVDVIGVATDFNSQTRLARSCARQNYKPEWILATPANFADFPEFTGAVTATQVFPFALESAETLEYHEAMQRYAPGLQGSVTTALGWVSAKLFERAASQIEGEVTSPELLASLWSLKNETLGGLASPLTFIRDKPALPAACVFALIQRVGKYEAPQGLTPLCRQ